MIRRSPLSVQNWFISLAKHAKWNQCGSTAVTPKQRLMPLGLWELCDNSETSAPDQARGSLGCQWSQSCREGGGWHCGLCCWHTPGVVPALELPPQALGEAALTADTSAPLHALALLSAKQHFWALLHQREISPFAASTATGSCIFVFLYFCIFVFLYFRIFVFSAAAEMRSLQEASASSAMVNPLAPNVFCELQTASGSFGRLSPSSHPEL